MSDPPGTFPTLRKPGMSSCWQALISQNLNTGCRAFCIPIQRPQCVRDGGADTPSDCVRWGPCQAPGTLQLCELRPFLSALSGPGPRAPASMLRAPRPPQHPMWAAHRAGVSSLCLPLCTTWRAFVSSQVNPLTHCLGSALPRPPPAP